MNRLESVRQIVDGSVRGQPDLEESRCGFVHLYGVSATCALLARKRGLDAELCATAGMLHDISTYETNDDRDHARLSAGRAATILRHTGAYTEEEIAAICDAIAHHSDKAGVHGALAELLKDADVLQHYLYNPALLAPEWKGRARAERICAELGLA